MARPHIENPAPGVQRMRLTRERRRRGEVVVTMLLGARAQAALASRGFLAPDGAGDVVAVTEALSGFLRENLLGATT
jgi:hypothetical protein